jgi:hypothetical protein
MSKMKNEIFRRIALEAGGSHYPEVGGDLLEKYSELLIHECAELMYGRDENGNCKDGDTILEHFGVKE